MVAERSSSGRFVKKSDSLASSKQARRAQGHSQSSHSGSQPPSDAPKNPQKKSLRSLGAPAPANTSIVERKRSLSRQSVTHTSNGVPPTKRPPKHTQKDVPNARNASNVAQISDDASKSINEPDEKRKLRSQGGGSRSKSDLVHFFPDYEDFVFGPTKEPEFLTVDSTLFITKDAKQHDLPIREVPGSSTTAQSPIATSKVAKASAKKSLAERNGIEFFDFSKYAKAARKITVDPLGDEVFLPGHRRGERKEKQLRNIEKEHARHERSDLERLKEELQGPDWLKTMGISGITDTEKKRFETKRDFYMRGVNALLKKFSNWDQQEKELKLKKEQALAAREAEDYEDEVEEEEEGEEDLNGFDGEEVESSEQDDVDSAEVDEIADSEEEEEEDATSKGPTDSSGDISHIVDGDESARQLLLEAKSAKRSLAISKGKKRPLSSPVPPEDELDHSITSFFRKSYQRDAAIGKHRRGRSANAFGHPVPEPYQREFNLPGEYVSEETVTANARKRRRLKRTKES